MRRSSRALVAWAALAALFAGQAVADDLYATVDRTAAPDEPAVVHVEAGAPGPVTLLVYRVEDPATLLDAGLDPRRGDEVYARLQESMAAARKTATVPIPDLPRPPARTPDGAPLAPVSARLTFVAAKTATLASPRGAPRPGEERQAPLPSATVEVALPSAGLHVIEVRRDGAATAVTALASRLALVTKRDPGGFLAFAVDRTSGLPLPGVKVDVLTAGRPLASGTTDAKGLVRLDVGGHPEVETRAVLGNDLAFGTDVYYPADVTDRRVYAFTHQPAYRPGERVEAKGVVRAWRDGAYALDADVHEVLVRFVANGDREVGRATAPVSADLGTFSASCDLPQDAPTGDASIVVEVGPKSYAAPFRIEAYRKPTFEVVVTAAPARVAAGADLSFGIAGTYFEGGPLSGAPATYEVRYHRVDRDLFPTDELARLFFGREREAYAARVVAQGSVTLDATGRATVTLKAPDERQDGFLSLEAHVTAPDRTTVAGTGTSALSALPLTVALKSDKHLYGAEGVARVTVRAALADGRPAAARDGVLTASLEGAPQAREGGPTYQRVLPAIPFTTDAAGAAQVEVPFPENGRWLLTVSVPRRPDEREGPAATAALHVWVAGDRADLGWSGDHVEIVADRDSYAVGDTARLLVLAPVGARPFLSTVEGGRILSFGTVDLGGRAERGASALVEVRVGPEHVPNAYVGIALVDHGNLLSTEKLLRVPPVDRVLTPAVRAARTEIGPGETLPMTLAVNDSAGHPVAGAEVAVAVVDDALYGLYADPAAPLVPFFHAVRRNDVRTGGPLHLASVGWMAATEVALADAAETAGGGGSQGGRAGRAMPGGAMPLGAPPPAPTGPPPAARPERPAPASPRAAEGLDAGDEAPAKKDGAAGAEGPVAAREDFRTAVWWSPAVRTGEDGTAALGPVRFGESLTRWRISAWAVDARTRVGSSVTTVRTVRPVLTRVTLPRFLRATDTVLAPWVLHNLTAGAVEADFAAGATGLDLQGPRTGHETIGAGTLVTHDLHLAAPAVGLARVNAEIRTAAGSDAVAVSVPVLPQGIPKVLSQSGVADGAALSLPPFSIPPTAEHGTARLRVVVSPSVAQAVGAALPYLADYPYGCTEQTMSRLVPAVVAWVATHRFQAPLRGRLAELPRMLSAGLARLAALQHADGGFGWWPKDASDPWMTAYVVHGLTQVISAMADPAPAKALLDRAVPWLASWIEAPGPAEKDGTLAFVLMALAEAGGLPPGALPPAGYDGRFATPVLDRAFLLRAAAAAGRPGDVAVHAKDLALQAVRDAAGVHFEGAPGPAGGRGPASWAQDPVETTAWALGALLVADPKHPDLAPGVRWLLAQRVGDHWKSTRDSAAVVAFLTSYAAATGDLGSGRRVAVALNGRPVASVAFTVENAFTDAGLVEVPESGLPSGPLTVTVTPDAGSVAVVASLAFTETGPAIAASASGFEVKRTWWRLEPTTGSDGKPVVRRVPVTETVPSGTLLDVDVTVTTDRDREFVVVTSPHAAGFEPEKDLGTAYAEPPPGAWGGGHVETLDDRTAFFAARLAAGTHVFRHRVRASHAGSFTALPAQAELMYFPDVRGNGTGEVLEVSKGGAAGAPEGRR